MSFAVFYCFPIIIIIIIVSVIILSLLGVNEI